MSRIGICPGCDDKKPIRNDGYCGKCKPRREEQLGRMVKVSKHGRRN